MKFKRLPNGFGQISKLSGNRSRPFMVRNSNRKVLGYTATYQDAYKLLIDYNTSQEQNEKKEYTFLDLWNLFTEMRSSDFSASTIRDFRASMRHLSPVENEIYASFKTPDFMNLLNSLDCTDNTKRRIIVLLKHFDDIAYQLDIISKKYAYELRIKPPEKIREREVFTEEQIEILWNNLSDPFVPYILILIYTGLRRNELLALTRESFDLENWTITGGSKTKAGKNRLVPIHRRIRPLISSILENATDGRFITMSTSTFYDSFCRKTEELLGRRFIPHEARHTMRTRLDRVGANKVATDRILGHKSGDTGMDIYTHKSPEELAEAVALLP